MTTTPAPLTAKDAYTKGWSTNPETRADIPVYNFENRYPDGPAFRFPFMQGMIDKRNGAKKWTSFDPSAK